MLGPAEMSDSETSVLCHDVCFCGPFAPEAEREDVLCKQVKAVTSDLEEPEQKHLCCLSLFPLSYIDTGLINVL